MTLSWAPVYGTPELNCSLMKDFIPLYRLLWAGSQCSVPFSTSLNGFCWIFIHFCSFGCKCLGKWLHFFQCLQSFPSKSWSHHEASEVYLLFSKEGRKVSMWSNLLAAPGILHLWKAQSEGSWRMGNPTCNYFQCLVPGNMTDLLTSWLSRFLASEEEHKWHESTGFVCWRVLFLSTFYAKHCCLSKLLKADSGFQQDKSFFPGPLGWTKSPAISSGFGWVWLNSAGVVSCWARKWRRVLRRSNKVSGSIKCQKADKRRPVCSGSLKSHILAGLKPGSPNFLPKLLLLAEKPGQAAWASLLSSPVSGSCDQFSVFSLIFHFTSCTERALVHLI